ncbi:MAG: hypothetical protein FWD69_04580 [Polyangiaceae bacterium]|nr:hypothetical protein [Polyangiaceae bacterium]
MNQVHGNGKSSKQARHAHRESAAEESIRHRVGNARDIVENVRDQAEAAFRDKPYLVPAAACALGVGIGMLLGSRITRFLVFTAVGAVLTDLFGGELRRMGRDFVDDLQLRLAEGTDETDDNAT